LAHLEAWIDFAEFYFNLMSRLGLERSFLRRARDRLYGALYSTMDCADDARLFTAEWSGRFDQIIRSQIMPLAAAVALIKEALTSERLATPQKQDRFLAAFMRAMRASPDRYLVPPNPRDPLVVTAFLARLAPMAPKRPPKRRRRLPVDEAILNKLRRAPKALRPLLSAAYNLASRQDAAPGTILPSKVETPAGEPRNQSKGLFDLFGSGED
jgi:hypothetical protein